MDGDCCGDEVGICLSVVDNSLLVCWFVGWLVLRWLVASLLRCFVASLLRCFVASWNRGIVESWNRWFVDSLVHNGLRSPFERCSDTVHRSPFAVFVEQQLISR